MHSQLALTDHATLNLAPLILLDPVEVTSKMVLPFLSDKCLFIYEIIQIVPVTLFRLLP